MGQLPDDKRGTRAYHYRCRACGHAIDRTPEQHLALMRMTPVCPECGSIEVESTGRTVKPPKVGPALLIGFLFVASGPQWMQKFHEQCLAHRDVCVHEARIVALCSTESDPARAVMLSGELNDPEVGALLWCIKERAHEEIRK